MTVQTAFLSAGRIVLLTWGWKRAALAFIGVLIVALRTKKRGPLEITQGNEA